MAHKKTDLELSEEEERRREVEFFYSQGWVKDFQEARDSNHSNAFVFPTMDATRWTEIRRIVRNMEFEDGRAFYEWYMLENRVLKYTPQFDAEGRLSKVKVEEYVPSAKNMMDSDGNPIVVLDLSKLPAPNVAPATTIPPHEAWKIFSSLLRREQTTVIVHATNLNEVMKEQHDTTLDNLLGAVAKDPQVFANRSSLVAIMPSTSYLSEGVRKLCRIIEPPLPSPEEREMHIKKKLRAMRRLTLQEAEREGKSEKEKKKILNYFSKLFSQVNGEVINASAGLMLDEVESALLLSINKYKEIKPEVFRDYKIELLKKVGVEYVEPQFGFEAVGGYDDLKEYMRDIVDVIKHPEITKDFGERVPSGLLLYGLAGTGKTWFAHALAKELNLPVVKISPSDFLRGIVGETEQRIKQITRIIDTISPAVVFIDEIDQLAMRRDTMVNTDSGVSTRMISGLLSWLGSPNRKALLVGTTNYLEHMDKAFIRSGRIDRIVFVPTPDLQGRKEILEIHMLKINPVNTNVVKFNRDILWEVAKRTEGWTGADLRLLCENVKRLARKETMNKKEKEIDMEHFIRAMEDMGVDAERRKQEQLKMLHEMETVEGGNKDMGYIRKVKRQIGFGQEKEASGDERFKSVSKKKKIVDIGDDLGLGL